MNALPHLIYQHMQREWRVQMRQKKSWANSLIFFCMILLFFPLALPADPQLHRLIAPGVVWIALLLSNLLSAERLFQSDYDEGLIELWLISGQPLSAVVFAKIVLHWIITLIPLLCLSPIIAILFGLNAYSTWVLMTSLCCGMPVILLLSGLAAAYGTVLQQKGLIMSLVLFPLIIPIMIFGAATTNAAASGLAVNGYYAILLALSLLAFISMPFAIASVIRAHIR